MADRPAPRSQRPAARLSAICFAVASVFFLCGWGLASIAAPHLLDFFYQPRPLAVTHTFTLGWVSLMMIGVLYQYVPALTKRPLGLPALAPFQVGLFVAGVVGLVSHFWLGATDATAWSAAMIAVSVLLFAAEIGPSLLRAERWDATVLGIGVALLCFVATALLGFLFALDKAWSFLPGSVLTNIAGHAHLGLLGWITLTICAVSYRMVAAFLLPTEVFPVSARRQIALLSGAVVALAVTLMWRTNWVWPFALAVLAAMGWYGLIIGRLLRTRRMPVDWSICHVFAALAHLAAAAVCGMLLLLSVDPVGASGNRLAVAYGLFLLIGWTSNFIVGVGSRMLPGLIGAGATPLLSPVAAGAVFALLNGGIAAAAASAIAGETAAFRWSCAAPFAAAALFAAALAQRVHTLSRTQRA
jgi:hypothetical protein